MTSIHINSGDSQTATSTLNGSLNQSQTPSRYDEAGRVRQRLEELRRHHAQTADIHSRTQPLIDEQIHEETIKYLKSNQVNGTKAKSQKPRAPKRQRTQASNNNNNSSGTNGGGVGSSTGNNNNGTIHQVSPQHQQQPQLVMQQVPPQPQVIMQAGLQPMQQIASACPPHMQPQPVHVQSQPRSQSQMHQQPHHPQQSYNATYHSSQYQPSPVYAQQTHMQPITHNQHMQPDDRGGHYMPQQKYAQQNHHGFYPAQPSATSNNNNYNQSQHHNHNYHQRQNNYTALPTDLDFNLQAGLECDIDSLIKHEMSVEGQLDFNHDLLLKLDNHYQPKHQ